MEQLKKVSIVSVPYTLFFQYNCQHENVLNWIQVMKISHLDIPNQALNWMFDSLVKTGEYVDIILLVLEEFSGHVYSICKTLSPSFFSVSSVCCPENSSRAVVEKFVQRGAQNASEFALKWPLATRSPISVRLSAAVWQHCVAPKMFEKYSVRLWLSQKHFTPNWWCYKSETSCAVLIPVESCTCSVTIISAAVSFVDVASS